MKNLDKYKSAKKNISDFEGTEVRKLKPQSKVKNESLDFEDYAPVVVNSGATSKLQAEKQHEKYLNSISNSGMAGWKMSAEGNVKNERKGTDLVRKRMDSPDAVERRVDTNLNARDLSPPRKRHDSPVVERDLSPPRRRRNDSPESNRDLSPPRRQRGDVPTISENKGQLNGLVTSGQLKTSMDAKTTQEKVNFEKMDPSMTGKGVSTIFRDKDGKKISEQEYIDIKKKERERKKDFTVQSEFEWGTGLVQKKQLLTEEEELDLERAKPFARYAGKDDDVEDELKQIMRDGDPMAKFLKKKKHKHKERKDFPPNRYMIPPGPKWDGIDRSNGFEAKYFQAQNKKKSDDDQIEF